MITISRTPSTLACHPYIPTGLLDRRVIFKHDHNPDHCISEKIAQGATKLSYYSIRDNPHFRHRTRIWNYFELKKGFWVVVIVENSRKSIEFLKYLMLKLNLLSAHCNPLLRDRFIDSNGSVLCPIVSFTISNSLPSTYLVSNSDHTAGIKLCQVRAFENQFWIYVFQLCGDDEGVNPSRIHEKEKKNFARDTTTRNAREPSLENFMIR